MGMEFSIGGSWWRGYNRHGSRLLLVVMASVGGGGDDKVCRWWGQRWKMKIKMLFTDCYVDDAPKKSSTHVQQQFKWTKIQIARKRNPAGSGIIEIVDCSITPPKHPWFIHDLSSRDARERSNRWADPHRSSILGAGSWRPFWFDHIFRSMIFGLVMAKIRHGGGSRTVAFRPFSEVVRCCFF